jgi:hypothetical protein
MIIYYYCAICWIKYCVINILHGVWITLKLHFAFRFASRIDKHIHKYWRNCFCVLKITKA